MNNIVSPAYRKVELLYGKVSRDTDHDVMSEEELAVAYVNGEIPETIKNFTCDTHPMSYIAGSSVGAVL